MADDRDALRELLNSSKPGSPHVIEHYLYVPSKKVAATVVAELKRLGFETEDRRGALGDNWLVLARHTVLPTNELLSRTRQQMEALAATVNGEYDGWEAKTIGP